MTDHLSRTDRSASEWELAKDRELDQMTDEQLIYLDAAIEVTLEERGWYCRDGDWRKMEDDDA